MKILDTGHHRDTKNLLSTLWIVIMFNMVFADVFLIIIEFIKSDALDIPGEVRTIMAIAAVLTNIPILMILFSKILPYKSNRIANISAALFTILYVVAGGDTSPHYFIIASLEILLCITIIVVAWNWKIDSKMKMS